MGIGAHRNKDNENVQELNKMVKEVEKKTGGLL
jgi:C4-dicarboxylate transporter DctQ subunit